jgi:hypothetical protein
MARNIEQKQARRVSVTVTVKIYQNTRKSFVATLDEKSRQDYFNWIANNMIRYLKGQTTIPTCWPGMLVDKTSCQERKRDLGTLS